MLSLKIKKIIEELKNNGFSLRGFIKENDIKINHATLNNYLNGKTKPDSEILDKILNILEINQREFILDRRKEILNQIKEDGIIYFLLKKAKKNIENAHNKDIWLYRQISFVDIILEVILMINKGNKNKTFNHLNEVLDIQEILCSFEKFENFIFIDLMDENFLSDDNFNIETYKKILSFYHSLPGVSFSSLSSQKLIERYDLLKSDEKYNNRIKKYNLEKYFDETKELNKNSSLVIEQYMLVTYPIFNEFEKELNKMFNFLLDESLFDF